MANGPFGSDPLGSTGLGVSTFINSLMGAMQQEQASEAERARKKEELKLQQDKLKLEEREASFIKTSPGEQIQQLDLFGGGPAQVVGETAPLQKFAGTETVVGPTGQPEVTGLTFAPDTGEIGQQRIGGALPSTEGLKAVGQRAKDALPVIKNLMKKFSPQMAEKFQLIGNPNQFFETLQENPSLITDIRGRMLREGTPEDIQLWDNLHQSIQNYYAGVGQSRTAPSTQDQKMLKSTLTLPKGVTSISEYKAHLKKKFPKSTELGRDMMVEAYQTKATQAQIPEKKGLFR